MNSSGLKQRVANLIEREEFNIDEVDEVDEVGTLGDSSENGFQICLDPDFVGNRLTT